MKVSRKEAEAIVRLKYPYAKALKLEPMSANAKWREWWQIISPNRITWVGQGATEREAWISAANYIVEDGG